MEISNILNQIDIGFIALPRFQRGYVWNRDQVRGLRSTDISIGITSGGRPLDMVHGV